jgi:hypothetical protein
MAKIDRFNGNVQPFAAESLGTERTIFGDTSQSNTLDGNITADFLRGWGIVGVNENPTKQDFNGLAFTLGQLIAYLHQRGVPEWNAAQEYYEGSVVTTLAGGYRLLSGGNGAVNPDNDDGTNWEKAPTRSEVPLVFPTVAAMQAATGIQVGQVLELNAGGRSGVFDVIAGDFSTELAADTLSGIYVALADDTAANTKAAVRRNISRVNVSWFGAVGDNTADDTDAIEAALEFKNVFLPEGDFRVTKTINIVSGVSIIGEGQLLSNIYFAPEAGEINLFLFGGSDFCNFSRFAVYGPGATGNAEQGFSLDDNDSSGSERQALFSELIVKEFDGAGFALSGHWTVSISHSEIRNCGVRSTPTTGTGGIAFVGSPNLSGWSGSGTDINNCYFSGNSYGIYGENTWCALVRLCIFEYNAYPFFKNTNGKAITFDSCWFEANDFAPDVGGSVAIKNCRGYSTGGHNLTFGDQGVIIEDSGSLELYRGTTPFLKMNARDGFTTDITIQEKQVRNITDSTSVNVELPFSVNSWGKTATLLFDDVVSGNADIVIGEIYAAGKDANAVRKWTVYRESAGSAFTITTDIAAGSPVGGRTATITLSENGAGALELQGSWAFNGQGFFGYFKGLVSNT